MRRLISSVMASAVWTGSLDIVGVQAVLLVAAERGEETGCVGGGRWPVVLG